MYFKISSYFKIYHQVLPSPVIIGFFKVNNKNTGTMHQICSKLAVKAQNNNTDILLILFLKINIGFSNCSGIFIADFEQVNSSWVKY